MMFSSLLSRGTVIADLNSTDKKGAIRELVEKLYECKAIPQKDTIEKALLDRERLGSTGIGNQVAIPHAKCDNIGDLVAAFGKSESGVEFDALDRKKVHYVFLLLAPKGEAGKHLKALARISRLVRIDGFCSKLKSLSTEEDILEALNQAEQSL
ncbi:MAG: PTS fructose transporter subunit IIA [bacterium]|nr:MAG: PTS fructose transporter subunit IIA [bacterium]